MPYLTLQTILCMKFLIAHTRTQIGHYDDSQIEDLIPLSEMNLDSDLEQIFRDVFRREASQRPTALELLNHPRISSAYEYESCFDEFYEEEGPSQMDLNHPQEQVEITERESLYSNDVVSNLPEFESSKKANNQRPSQDSGIGIADLGDSFDGGCGPMRSSTAPAVLHAGQTVNGMLINSVPLCHTHTQSIKQPFSVFEKTVFSV